MTITVDFTPNLEARIQEAAAKAGLSLTDYVTNILEQHLSYSASETKNLSEAETALLQEVNLGLTQETWDRYHLLVEKRQAETLTAAEQRELIEISDKLETANARRMSALIKLAHHRQVPLATLMTDLGITPPSYD